MTRPIVGHGRSARCRVAAGSLAAALFVGLPAMAATPAPAVWLPSFVVQPLQTTEVSAFGDGTAFVFMSGRNLLLRSSNFGLTWKRLPTPPNQMVTPIVRMATPLIGYETINAKLFRTIDGAKSWRQIPSPPATGYLSINALGVADGGRTIVLGSNVYPSTGGFAKDVTIFTTHDSGTTWIIATLPFSGVVTEVRMLDGDTGLLRVTESDANGDSIRDAIFLTRNGGMSYVQIFNCPGLRVCTTMAMADAQRIVVGRNDGAIFVSRDGGATFEQGPTLTPPVPFGRTALWVQGIGFATPRRGFASVKGGGTYRTDDGGITWVLERSPDPVWGVGVGEIAVADAEHAIIAGPTFVSTRVRI